VRDETASADSSSVHKGRKVKIVVVNFPCSPAPVPATLSPVSLHIGIVTVVVSKHPSRPVEVIGAASAARNAVDAVVLKKEKV
jgi:hypothetical protein